MILLLFGLRWFRTLPTAPSGRQQPWLRPGVFPLCGSMIAVYDRPVPRLAAIRERWRDLGQEGLRKCDTRGRLATIVLAPFS